MSRGLQTFQTEGLPNRLNKAVGRCLWLGVRAYQYLLSPWLGPSCRYLPSCSDYAQEAIEVHGPWRGSWLALRRIGRCHPLGGSGFDPVPVAAASQRKVPHQAGDCHEK